MIDRRGFLRLMAGAAALPVVPIPEPQWNTMFFTGREPAGMLFVDVGCGSGSCTSRPIGCWRG